MAKIKKTKIDPIEKVEQMEAQAEKLKSKIEKLKQQKHPLFLGRNAETHLKCHVAGVILNKWKGFPDTIKTFILDLMDPTLKTPKKIRKDEKPYKELIADWFNNYDPKPRVASSGYSVKIKEITEILGENSSYSVVKDKSMKDKVMPVHAIQNIKSEKIFETIKKNPNIIKGINSNFMLAIKPDQKSNWFYLTNNNVFETLEVSHLHTPKEAAKYCVDNAMTPAPAKKPQT
jgi:hypothetical protein